MSSPARPRPRVLVLRPAESGRALVEALERQGLAAEHHPLIELVPEPPDTPAGRSLRQAVADWVAGEHAWLVLTSPVALDALDPLITQSLQESPVERSSQADTVDAPPLDRQFQQEPRATPRPSGTPDTPATPSAPGDASTPRRPTTPAAPLWPRPAGARIAVVGRGTAETLRERGLEPDLVAHGSGTSLVADMPPPAPHDRELTGGEDAATIAAPGSHPGTVHRPRPTAVLFPASAAAAPTVPEGLAALGYTVRREIAYRPREIDLPEAVVRDLRTGAYAAVVLTSGSIARAAARIGMDPSTRVVTIGGPTTRAAQAAGLTPAVQAREPSTTGLTNAVIETLAAGAAETASP